MVSLGSSPKYFALHVYCGNIIMLILWLRAILVLNKPIFNEIKLIEYASYTKKLLIEN